MQEYETAYSRALIEAIARWMETELTPEYMEFKERHIGHILFNTTIKDHESVAELKVFSGLDKREGEHTLITTILNLIMAIETLSQIKFYFVRFPFRGLPISKEDHCRNICEFYFSTFYVIRCRLKEMLNVQQEICLGSKTNIKKILKVFDVTFDQELRERNGIIHHTPFSEIGLERIAITGLVSRSGKKEDLYWSRTHTSSYRKFCKEWSARVTRRQLDMRTFMDVVFQVIFEQSEFLQQRPISSSEEC